MTVVAPELIALDVDGTLIRGEAGISERVKRSIRLADGMGIRVVLASGRSTVELQPVVEELGLVEGYTICSNGAVTAVLPDQTPVLTHTFDPRAVLEQVLAEVPTALVAVEEPGLGYLVTDHFPHGELLGPQTRVALSEMVTDRAVRVIVRDVNRSVEDFLGLTERLHIRGVSYAVGYRAWLDLGPDGITKGTALAALAEGLNIPASRCLAIGDGRNDVEMITWAGCGVAMGQAPDAVQAAANWVTATVEDDGVAVALERFLVARTGV